MKKYQRIEVEFIDITQNDSWLDEGDIMCLPDVAYCKVMGYYMGKIEGCLILSTMKSEDNTGSRVTIPEGCIVRVKTLR